MAELLVLGAGVVGLGTALLLAKDGHHVTILERDPQPPPEFAIAAWETWERRGVNQFRLPHFFLARWRTILDGELPHVTEAIQAAGGLRYNPLLALPEAVRGPARTEDAQLEVLTGRRPLVECALAEAAAGHPAIKSLPGCGGQRRPEREGHPGRCPPRARRADRERRRAHGRPRGGPDRPAFAAGVPAHRGGRPAASRGLRGQRVYVLRRPAYYRSPDGTIPPMFGPVYQPLGTIGSVTLAADNGTWCVVLVAAAHDRALYGLRDVLRWERALWSLPGSLTGWTASRSMTG